MLYSFIIRFTDIQKLKSSCEILAISNKMSKLVYILLQTWEFTMQKFFTRHICLKHFFIQAPHLFDSSGYSLSNY